MRGRSLLQLLTWIACGWLGGGGCSSYKPDGTGDQLIGTWFADDGAGQTETLTLGTDTTYSWVWAQVNLTSSADHPGCTYTTTDTGTFSDNGTLVTFTSNVTADTSTYAGCVNASDDGTTTVPTPWEGPMIVGYTVTATTLTLDFAAVGAGSNTEDYTRR